MRYRFALLAALVLCLVFAVPASAQTAQDGLALSVSTDKQVYRAREAILVTVEARNQSDAAISAVQLNLLVPEGYALMEGCAALSPLTNLASGDTLTLETALVRSAGSIPSTGDNADLLLWALGLGASLWGLLSVLRRGRGRSLLALLLCAALMGSGVSLPNARAEVSLTEDRSLTDEVTLTAAGKPLTLSAQATYTADIPYTRAGWLRVLMTLLGHEGTSAEEPSFTDTAGHPDEGLIEAAAVLGILDPGGKLNPDAPADRDFVAMTSVRGLGYAMGDSLACADAAAVPHPDEAAVAVRAGLMPLVGGSFLPAWSASRHDASLALQKVRSILRSSTVTGEGGEGFVYREGVILLPDSTVYSANGGTLTLVPTASTPALKAGDILVIGNAEAFRVESIRTEGGLMKIAYTQPELEEFLSSVDIYGKGYADLAAFQPAEGVEIQSAATYRLRSGHGYDSEEGLKLAGTVKLHDKWQLHFEATLDMKDVSYKADIDFNANGRIMDVKNAFISVDLQTQATAGLSTTEAEGSSKFTTQPSNLVIPVGRLPIFGFDGFGAELEIALAVEAEGKVEVVVTHSGIAGVQILDNDVRNISAISKDQAVKLAAQVSAGPEVSVSAELFHKKLLSFSMVAGVKASGAGVWRPQYDTYCLDAALSVFCRLEALKGTVFDRLGLELSWTLFDHPIGHLHFENTEIVTHCTSTLGTISGTVIDESSLSPISGASVSCVSAENGSILTPLTTGTDGSFTFHAPQGAYTLTVTASGYLPLTVNALTSADAPDLHLPYLRMAGSSLGTAAITLGGRVYDGAVINTSNPIISGNMSFSSTNRNMSGASVEARSGWNVTSGTVVASTVSDQGSYRLQLQPGYYTLTFTKEGFITNTLNVVTRSSSNLYNHTALHPRKGISTAYNVVLTWNSYMPDLDAHFLGTKADSPERFHIYTSGQTDYSYYIDEAQTMSRTAAQLSENAQSYFGPEVLRFTPCNEEGVYSFYVHTPGYTGNYALLCRTNARVQVFQGDALLATYEVPTSRSGTAWHVFDYYAATDTFRRVDGMSSPSSSANVGK